MEKVAAGRIPPLSSTEPSMRGSGSPPWFPSILPTNCLMGITPAIRKPRLSWMPTTSTSSPLSTRMVCYNNTAARFLYIRLFINLFLRLQASFTPRPTTACGARTVKPTRVPSVLAVMSTATGPTTGMVRVARRILAMRRSEVILPTLTARFLYMLTN